QPVVQGPREDGGEVLVAEALEWEQRVADGMGEAEAIEGRLGNPGGVGVGAVRTPVRPAGERRGGWVGDGGPRLDAAPVARVPPMVVHVAGEFARCRQPWMDVAVDRTSEGIAQGSGLRAVLARQANCFIVSHAARLRHDPRRVAAQRLRQAWSLPKTSRSSSRCSSFTPSAVSSTRVAMAAAARPTPASA